MTRRTYGYPAKDTVRQAWMRFLPPDLAHPLDYGLYLPAPENLELPGYRAKGMRAKRLIGAEHLPSLFPETQRRSGGIHLVKGSIIDALHYIESRAFPRLRFANLDFDGNLHTFIEELLALARVFPSSRGGYLSVTSYAARDRGALLQGIINMCKFYSGLPSTTAFIRQYGQMFAEYERLLEKIPNAWASPHSHLQRESELMWWLVLMFSVVEPILDGMISVFNQTFIDRLDQASQSITEQVIRELIRNPDTDRMIFVANRALRDVLADRQVHWWINGLERYAYWTDARQPMRTWNVRIVPLEHGQVETAQSLLSQIWELVTRTPLVYIDEHGQSERFR